MRDAWEYVKDRWECDSFFREQIVLAIILGVVGLLFAFGEGRAKRVGLGEVTG